MRYAIVTETYPPEVNGVALTVQALEWGLRARGHEVMLVRPRQGGDASAPAPGMEQDVPTLRPATVLVPGTALPRYQGLRMGLPAGHRLAAKWRDFRPEAVYVATEGPLGWSALRVARRLQIPVATGLHTRFDCYMGEYGLPWLARGALGWMRHFHNAGQATLVPTRELAAEMQGKGFRHMVRLARAVDTQRFDPAHRDADLRRAWGLQDHQLAVIHVGRIAPEKNLGLAVAAFRSLQRQRPDARFVWVGDGPAREQLQRDNPDFILSGVQRGHELARHFASADLFLFPSLSETFGNVTLEAMASGVATVAFDQGAAREHLHAGCGAAVADAPSFIDAALRIAADDDLRAILARHARAAVIDLHPARVATDFDAILASLARSRSCHAHPSPA